MTKIKSTKRALLMSALALVLCVSMLVGSTFAWFTDSVVSGNNIIKSGNLKVDLLDKTGHSLAGEVLKFVAADGSLLDGSELWEPGCTYNLQPVFVKNAGNLALKYEIVINGINGNAKLLEAIEWSVTVGGTSMNLNDLKGELLAGEKTGAIVLTGHMREDAGNEYQGLTAEGISIAVFATQLASESDSFNNQYDANAAYAAQTMLKEVAAGTSYVKLDSDGYVVINEDNPIGAVVSTDVTLDLNGKTLFVKVEDGDEHMSLFNIVRGGKLTVTGKGTIEMLSGKNPSKVTAIFNNTGGTVVIENGTYKMDVKTYAQGSLIPAIIDNNGNAAGATAIINGGDFYHTRNMFRNFPSNNGITELIINGGTFNGKADDWANIWNQKASSNTNEGQSLITVNGGKFNYVVIDNEFNGGVTVANGVVAPTSIDSVADLTAALAAGGEYALTDDVIVNDFTGSAFTVPNGVTAKIHLAGNNILATSTSAVGTELFSVSGNLEFAGDGTISLTNDNFAWSDSYRYTPINIRETGVVTLGEGVNVVSETGSATAKGYGMNYAVDIYTTGVLNVNGASLRSNYIAVRCFYGNSVVNFNSGSISSSKNNWGIWPQSAPGATINVASGISYTTDSYGIYIFD